MTVIVGMGKFCKKRHEIQHEMRDVTVLNGGFIILLIVPFAEDGVGSELRGCEI